MLHILRQLKAETGSDNLVLGGGVFLNASLNGVIRRSGIFQNIFVPPAPHDAGTAIGAAIYGSMKSGASLDRGRLGLIDNPYLGSVFDDTQIETDLKRSKL